MSDELIAIAQTVRVDAMTAEVVGALRGRGLDPVLLKGPVIGRRLYPGELRPYVDADLLVAPDAFAEAGAALAGLGFERVERPWEREERVEHDEPWRRPDGAGAVDLHRTLPGVRGVAPAEAWPALAAHLESSTLPDDGGEVTVLDDAGLALLLCLHLAHHQRDGADVTRPVADLTRGVTTLPRPAWEAARGLAVRLRAEAQMARGLHAVPGGAALAAALFLPPPSEGHEGPRGLERLIAARGPRARAGVVLRALGPTPAYLRWRSPLARRGRTGLVLTYVARPAALAATAIRDGRRRLLRR